MRKKRLIVKGQNGISLNGLPTTGVSFTNPPPLTSLAPVITHPPTLNNNFAIKGLLSNMATGAITSYLGGLLGNAIGSSIGGDAGTVVSSTTSNLASNIGNTLMKGGGLKEGLKSFTSVGNLAGLGMGIGTSLLESHTAHSRYNGDKAGLAAGTDIVGSVLGMSGGLAGGAASLGMAAVNAVTGGTDGMTTQDALLGSNAAAGALMAIGGPWAAGAYMALSGLNSALGGTSHTMLNTGWQDTELLGDMWEGYSGSHKKDIAALNVAGKKYGFLSNSARHKANDSVDAANAARKKLLAISNKNEVAQIRGNKMIDINNLAYQLAVQGGYDQRFNRIGRHGMKLPSKEDIVKVRSILSHKFGGNLLPPKPELYSILAEFPEEIQEFKEGGQLNVIPEGALHARKHHMEDAEGLTKKGIPVVDKDGELQAEIERDEIIFRKEVTLKLEELMKDGSDKAAIEAGKLLVTEIFENTDDRTGLIVSIIGENPLSEEEELLSKMKTGGNVTPKRRSDTVLMLYANNSKVPFMERILNNDTRSIQLPNEKAPSTHLLGYGEINGKTYVFPSVLEDEDGNLKYYEWPKSLDRAIEKNNVLEMTPEEAEWFTTHYKNYYPKFFNKND